MTQAEFAIACGMDASTITDVLSGNVRISSRNIEKLLHGLPARAEQLQFLAAYLRDEIPLDYANDISVGVEKSVAQKQEKSAAAYGADEGDLLNAYRELSARKHRDLALSVIRQIRSDTELRNLISQVMEYADDSTTRALARANRNLAMRPPDPFSS